MKYIYEVKNKNYDELFTVLPHLERLDELLNTSKALKISDKEILLDVIKVINKLKFHD